MVEPPQISTYVLKRLGLPTICKDIGREDNGHDGEVVRISEHHIAV